MTREPSSDCSASPFASIHIPPTIPIFPRSLILITHIIPTLHSFPIMDQCLRNALLIQHPAICDTAKDLFRQASQLLGHRLTCHQEAARPYVCIELACHLHDHSDYTREFSIRCACVTKTAYTRTFHAVQKALNIGSRVSMRSLCIMAGLIEPRSIECDESEQQQCKEEKETMESCGRGRKRKATATDNEAFNESISSSASSSSSAVKKQKKTVLINVCETFESVLSAYTSHLAGQPIDSNTNDSSATKDPSMEVASCHRGMLTAAVFLSGCLALGVRGLDRKRLANLSFCTVAELEDCAKNVILMDWPSIINSSDKP